MRKRIPLADYLRRHKLTQVEFADRLGVHKNTVYRWLIGERRPDWETIRAIVRETDGAVTADSFLPPSRARERGCRAA